MTTLLLAGCGKMGSALLTRWLATSPLGIKHIAVVDPAATTPSSADLRFFPALDKIPQGFKPGIVVFAVKPQQMAETLPAYQERFGTAPLYLSIAAGQSLAFLSSLLGEDAAIIRAMPNTPAMIGEGMIALAAGANVTDAQKESAGTLLQTAGQILWVDESHMDAVTAISGSGPAYLFLFMEALAKAAVACGLDEATAMTLVRQTMRGSALLAETEDFATLRKNVTSPGGTTEAAIKTLQAGGFEKLVGEAANAALRRSHELNNA